jgi:hypothetical protein
LDVQLVAKMASWSVDLKEFLTAVVMAALWDSGAVG